MAIATSNPEAKSKLDELLDRLSVGILVTRHRDGSMHGRPMAVQRDLDVGELWLLTNVHSEKITDIEAFDEVMVTFGDPDKQCFVTITGKASIVVDQDVIGQHWVEAERIWFPDGPEDANLAAIHVAIDRADYWLAGGRKLGLAAVYLKALVTGVPSDREPETGTVTYA